MHDKPRRPRLLKTLVLFVALTILCAGLSHLAWTGFIVGYMRINNAERLPQIPKITDDGNKRGLIAAFFEEQRKGADKVAVITGSSMTFGYDIAASKIYTTKMRKRMEDAGYRVINLGIMAADLGGITQWVACPLYKTGHKPDLIVVEVPILNQNSYLNSVTKSMEASGVQKPRSFPSIETCPDNPVGSDSYFSYFWHRPYGVHWLSVLRDEFIFSFKNHPVALSPLPPEWLPSAKSYVKFRDRALFERREALKAFSTVSDKVAMFNSAMYVKGFETLGFDRRNATKQLKDGISFCHPSKRTVCIDTSPLRDQAEIYRDVAHFSVNGHAYFAGWLVDQLTPYL
ncbi:MAG TPA: hypothetical protein VIN59_07985 [Alphaproteobacteria bacterium]